MSRVSEYRAELRALTDWEPYLLAQSGLPGPRGNLELAHAVAQEGTEAQFRGWAALTAEEAPENTPRGFLAFCGVLGMGAILGRGRSGEHDDNAEPLQVLRARASDTRWRVREAVATGLQLWGDVDMPAMLAEMAEWARGGYYEQRAAAAALCEPRLLGNPGHAQAVLSLLDMITQGIAGAPALDRKSEPFRTLRQALGYCWSVAVVADPAAGLPRIGRWLAHPDLDVQWIMRENLKKKRLAPFLNEALHYK
jgi:hypothetical protein